MENWRSHGVPKVCNGLGHLAEDKLRMNYHLSTLQWGKIPLAFDLIE